MAPELNRVFFCLALLALLCRKFKASRESFDGVGLVEGDTCRVTDGSWQMLAFTAA